MTTPSSNHRPCRQKRLPATEYARRSRIPSWLTMSTRGGNAVTCSGLDHRSSVSETAPHISTFACYADTQIAMRCSCFATLAELAPDRAELAVSVGNILNLGESGQEPVKPIAVMREYVQALRALLAGEAVTLEGEIHRLRGAHMGFLQGVKIPIHSRALCVAPLPKRGQDSVASGRARDRPKARLHLRSRTRLRAFADLWTL
jgi:hypothetical protein